MGMLTFFPLAFLPGYIISWVLKKANLLRVPPEVELEGLDMAEFQQDFFPEFERVPEVIVLPDGQEVEAGPILLEGYAQVNGHRAGAPAERSSP
jgi:Amt family ammonium transporter